MELIVLDTSLKMLSVLDTFESLIWTERYSAYGDFEVYTSINDSILEILKDDYYLWLKESDQTMIVEDRKIESDAENGNHFTVTGRSLESILEPFKMELKSCWMRISSILLMLLERWKD